MTQAIAYLAFDGRCKEAMTFYAQALGGKIEMMMNGADSPMADHIPKEGAQRIIHARLSLPGGGMLYAGDTPLGMPYEGVKGVAIAVDYETGPEAVKVFEALAVGGQVTMPMQPMFWARQFGMVIDQFGVAWSVNGEALPM